MLRNILTRFEGMGTWPCDEINYLWRHGNATHPDDEFGREQAHGRAKRFIRAAFAKLARRDGLHTVVEKTCANSLRVGFVDEILPNCRFIFLMRDGRDVVASAAKRWKAPLELGYLARKARYVPVSDLPYYAGKYLYNRIYKILSRRRRLASWGPRFVGMDEALRQRDVFEVSALQWRRCVERAEEELARIEPARVYRLRYEDFVKEPQVGLMQLARFLDAPLTPERAAELAKGVHSGSVRLWQTQLPAGVPERVLPILAPVLERYDYH